MSLLTSFLVDPGVGKLTPDRFGVWTLSSGFSVPKNTPVGASNKLPFNTLKEGAFTDFDTSTFELFVSKKGIYNLSWYSEVNISLVASPGIIREATIFFSIYHLTGTTPKICNLMPIEDGLQCYGVGGQVKLDPNDVVVFGLFHDRFSNITVPATTTLRIELLHTL